MTKGAFFHYFKSKDEIGEAAIEDWCQARAAMYFEDMGDPNDDPLDRFYRWLDGLIESIRRPDERPVCLLGMMSQEMAGSNERMREICQAKLKGWTGIAADLLAAAREVHPPRIDFEPEQIGWMLNSIWQGSLLIAKTRQEPEVIASNLQHARAYIETLFAEEPAGREASGRNGIKVP